MSIRDTVVETLANSFKERDNRIKDESYYEAIELGIENTFAALYDANVSDEEILRVVYKYWGIPKQEAEERLIYEKKQAVIKSLRHYMNLQGYERHEINDFFQKHQVMNKIRHNKELWKLNKNPEKLFKIVQGRE